MVSRHRIWARRGGALGLLAVLVVGLVLLVGALAGGPPDPRSTRASFSTIGIDGDGWPLLTGEITEDGASEETWQTCDPRCGRAQPATDGFFTPGPTPAGARVRISARAGETVWEDFTPVWTGQVSNTRPPKLRGTPTLGTVVVPAGGSWTGGWQPGNGSELGVRACRTADATDCVAMTQSLIDGRGKRSLRLSPSLTGWYVGAIEVRTDYLATHTLLPNLLPTGPESAPSAPKPGQTVAVSPLIGPVR